MIVPYDVKRGHEYTGVGILTDMKMCHHAHIFELYLHNPCLTMHGYCEELERKFRLHVSNSLIQDWFMTLRPFKGDMCYAQGILRGY